MRQAGFEAAKKAGDAKKASNAKLLPQAKGSEQSGVSEETLQMLDNSAPTGMPPPSGTTDATSAMAAVTGSSNAESKADAVPATTPKSDQVADGMGKLNLGGAKAAINQPDEVTGTSAGKEETEESGKKTAIPEEPKAEEEEVENAGLKKMEHTSVKPATEEARPEEAISEVHGIDDASPTKEMTTSKEAQNLPGKKTQDQSAASGNEAEASVAD